MKLKCLLVILFSLSVVVAAPAPWGIAINEDIGECMNFWPGDEFAQLELLEGFVFYAPSDYGENTSFETNVGDCSVPYNAENNYRDCCEQLGLFFVDTEGISSSTEYASGYFVVIGILIVIVLVIWFFWRKRK